MGKGAEEVDARYLDCVMRMRIVKSEGVIGMANGV
jgi:hypothetical protein